MHQTLTKIQEHLGSVIAHVQSAVPSEEPFGNAHGNGSFPGLTRAELIEEAQSIVDLIEDQGGDDVGDHEVRLQDYARRLQHLQQQTVSQLWSNAGQAVPAYLFTLQGLRKALTPVLTNDGHAEAMVKLKKLATQLRSMEARLNGLEPRTASLSTMVERIEQARRGKAEGRPRLAARPDIHQPLQGVFLLLNPEIVARGAGRASVVRSQEAFRPVLGALSPNR